jgi:hypothetical protein
MSNWFIYFIGVISIIIGAEIGWFMSILKNKWRILFFILVYIVVLAILSLINNIEVAIYSFLLIVIMNIIILYILYIEKKKRNNPK